VDLIDLVGVAGGGGLTKGKRLGVIKGCPGIPEDLSNAEQLSDGRRVGGGKKDPSILNVWVVVNVLKSIGAGKWRKGTNQVYL